MKYAEPGHKESENSKINLIPGVTGGARAAVVSAGVSTATGWLVDCRGKTEVAGGIFVVNP